MKWIHAVVMILLCLALLLGSLSCGKVSASPTIPSNLTKTTSGNNNKPTFTWDAANDKDLGVSFYLVNIDGQGWWNIGNVTTYQCCNPLSDGSHTFQAKAVDNTGNKGAAASLTFVCDTTPPTISSVSTSDITASSASITWTTNEPASSEVEYGLTSAYGSNTTVDSTLVTSHSVQLTGLKPNTIYHYLVRSIDSCGNEALSGDESVTTPAKEPIAANLSVYCIGDSITYGLGCSPAGRYETTLQSLLDTLPLESCTVYNNGIGGNTTAQMLARFNTDVLSHSDCEYVLIWGGINDVGAGYDISIPEANLQAMFTQAHNAGIKVVSLNVSPLNYQWTPTKRASIKNINAWIAHTAINIDYKVDVYSALAIPDPNNPGYDELNPAYTVDGIHLDCAGYDLIAHTVFAGVVRPLSQNS